MADGDSQIRPSSGYAQDQLARAFVTALSHEDDETRRNAEGRIERWRAVLSGMASGILNIGGRQPVVDLPTWVTPEVVRGGFATGSAAAAGPLDSDEVAACDRAAIPYDRQSLFAHNLSDAGLAELGDLLDAGDYRVALPEHAALLTIAWLVRSGDRAAALELIDVLSPYTDRLRFTPRRVDTARLDPSVVFRTSAGQAATTLHARRVQPHVATMNETLSVWNPFADELLDLWLDVFDGERIDEEPTPEWTARAIALAARYEHLATTHTRTSKHRNPKENLGILVSATTAAASDRSLSSRQLGLLRHAITSMVAKRGAPGSPEHRALRDRQAQDASRPVHAILAMVVASRLTTLPPEIGCTDIESLLAPVTEAEAERFSIPVGAEIPAAIHAVVRRCTAGTIDELMASHLVPSAEVLASLVPQIAATTAATAYRDPALQHLMLSIYLAFRNRRSLLLLNLEHQVQLEELPWVAAVAPYRQQTDASSQASRAALVRLAELALTGFPDTILTNQLVRELDTLAREANLGLPFVEEVAADIFMGRFSPKFMRAAQLAAEALRGSLYERYYDIDYASVARLKAVGPSRTNPRSTIAPPALDPFSKLCRDRAGSPDQWSVAGNGTILEQCQILTTHNLATLTGPVGLAEALADQLLPLAMACADGVVTRVGRVENNPEPLRTIKDAAYAWRQMLFFASLLSEAEQHTLLAHLEERVGGSPDHVRRRLAPAIAGLGVVMAGGHLGDATGDAVGARRFLGWTVGRHWMLESKNSNRR